MDVDLHPDNRKLQHFAAALIVLLCVLAVREFLRAEVTAASILLAVAGASVLCALTKAQLLRPVYVALTVVTFPIGWTISQLIIAVLYYGLITPVAALLRLAGRDRLRLKRPTQRRDTYWIERKGDDEPGRYLKQF
jgi:hypothetical protein